MLKTISKRWPMFVGLAVIPVTSYWAATQLAMRPGPIVLDDIALAELNGGQTASPRCITYFGCDLKATPTCLVAKAGKNVGDKCDPDNMIQYLSPYTCDTSTTGLACNQVATQKAVIECNLVYKCITKMDAVGALVCDVGPGAPNITCTPLIYVDQKNCPEKTECKVGP